MSFHARMSFFCNRPPGNLLEQSTTVEQALNFKNFVNHFCSLDYMLPNFVEGLVNFRFTFFYVTQCTLLFLHVIG